MLAVTVLTAPANRPAVKGTALTDAQITDLLTKGAAGKKAPHGKAVAGLTGDQAKAVAAYVQSLK